MNHLLKKMKDLDQDERAKLRRYLGETKNRNDEKMEWMYKGDKPDSEEYLLGKKVDKHIEGEDNQKSDFQNTSFEEVIKRRADIDMKTKMREDPLYQIKMREEESKKRLLQNPIKMKQLQRMLEEKQKKKKKKKEKKKRKKKYTSEDSDDELLERYLSIIEEKKSKDKMQVENNISDASHSKKHLFHSHSEYLHKHTSDVKPRYSVRQSLSQDVAPKRRHYSSSSSDIDHKVKGPIYEYRDDKNDEGRSSSKRYGLIVTDEKKKERNRIPKKRSTLRSPVHTKSRVNSPPRRKLSKEEMNQRRQEMMENAKWRDEQREKNVESYKAQGDREEEVRSKMHSAGKSADFINPMMAKHVGESSVEDRIKRNIYSVQRTSASLDKKFTQK